VSRDELKRVQARLVELGYDPGPIDGIMGKRTKAAVIALQKANWLVPDGIIGPKTMAALFWEAQPPSEAAPVTVDRLRKVAPHGRKDILEGVVDRMATTGTEFGITTSPLRLCHFIAQAAHESDGFRTTREYWGPTAAQKRYEGRADLGNTQPGDGKRFMGRGIFQLTGRANYKTMSGKLGIDLTAEPELAAVPSTSTLIACHYWNDRALNAYADKDDLRAITKRINGGYNGLDDRAAYLKRAKAIWLPA
jgi:putative chitinase